MRADGQRTAPAHGAAADAVVSIVHTAARETFLDPREVARMRVVSRRMRDLASHDSLWLTIAGILLLRRLLPRQPPTDVLNYLVNRTMCAESICGTYTFEGKDLVKSARLVVTSARLGFTRPIARAKLTIEFHSTPGLQDVCHFALRYHLSDKKFHGNSRRRGLRSMVDGPRFSIIAAPHRRQWVDELSEHFERTRGGLRLILTIEQPNTWTSLFGSEVNDLIMVARRAPELAVDAEVPV
jgi:hypothetical protein